MKTLNYKTHNDIEIDVDQTSYRGTINTSFDKLTSLFGSPGPGSADYKTDVEWEIKFDDGMVATIYNWKNGIAYLGSNGTPIYQIDVWNVGGKTYSAFERIQTLLEEN